MALMVSSSLHSGIIIINLEIGFYYDSAYDDYYRSRFTREDRPRSYSRRLGMLPPKQVFVICDYIFALRIEMRLSDNYRVSILNTLLTLSSAATGKGFRDFTRADNIRYLERFRKDDSKDPTHKSFGTYNTNLVNLIKFFRWLYYPDLEPAKRPKPTVAQNLPKL
jgi:hypothetical protein